MKLILLYWSIITVAICQNGLAQEPKNSCKKAFVYLSEVYSLADTIKIGYDKNQIPNGFQAEINSPVCDDKLCANVVLKFYWDLAGNYIRFDTLMGKPLTKFDHKRFSNTDYQKLDEILKHKNSILRILEKADLVDKTVKIKATTVDAVTSATPATIKNAVVEGAVYSSYTLWNFVNGPVKESIRTYTLSFYTKEVARKLLLSGNYESQLFALKQMTEPEYDQQFELVIQVIRQSIPLIKAYIINKLPIPFNDQGKNVQFSEIFPELDNYSKSIYLERIAGNRQIAVVFLPLLLPHLSNLNEKQLEKCISAFEKFGISRSNL